MFCIAILYLNRTGKYPRIAAKLILVLTDVFCSYIYCIDVSPMKKFVVLKFVFSLRSASLVMNALLSLSLARSLSIVTEYLNICPASYSTSFATRPGVILFCSPDICAVRN